MLLVSEFDASIITGDQILLFSCINADSEGIFVYMTFVYKLLTWLILAGRHIIRVISNFDSLNSRIASSRFITS